MGKTARKVDTNDPESPRTICEETNVRSSSKKIRLNVPDVTVSDFAELEDLHRKSIAFPSFLLDTVPSSVLTKRLYSILILQLSQPTAPFPEEIASSRNIKIVPRPKMSLL